MMPERCVLEFAGWSSVALPARQRRLAVLAVASVLLLVVSACQPAAVATPTAPSPTAAATGTATAPTPADGETQTPGATATAPATTSPTGTPGELTAATLRLDFILFPYHMPFYYGVEQGYYAEEGIDLTIGEGQGSSSTAQLVGTGQDKFGFADTPTAVISISQGVPIEIVEVIAQRSSFAVACWGDDVEQPQDLVGKSVLLAPQESTTRIWPAFLAINEIDEGSVRVVNADPATKVRLFQEHRADCMADYVEFGVLQAQLVRPEIQSVLLWGDYGVDLMSSGIIVSEETAANEGDLVRAFLRATNRAWDEVCAEPQLGLDLYVERTPGLSDPDREFAEQNIVLSCQNLEPPSDSGSQRLGPISTEHFQRMLDILSQYGDLENPGPPETYYSNEFVPAPSGS